MTKYIWKCGKCNQEFDTTEAKEQHIVEVEWGTELEYICPICGQLTWSADAEFVRYEE